MTLRQDFTYAARLLRRSPIFTATATLSLAIGLAGSAAIFSLADGVLLRERPGIARPDELADIALSQDGACCDNLPHPYYVDLRRAATGVADLAAYRFGAEPMGLATDGEADRAYGSAVSANYFAVLGVGMTHGRGFRPEEDRPGTEGTVVLSHRLSHKRFGGQNPEGRQIRLNGRPFTVIGVASDGFIGHDFTAADLWIPLALFPATTGRGPDLLTDREIGWVQAIARRRAGVSLANAGAAIEGLHERLRLEHALKPGKGIAVSSSSRVPREIRPLVATFIAALSALAGLIVSIACTNVAGMMLARSVTRSRDVALRLALGASRGRIIRELVAESVLVATAGAAAGLLGAAWLIRALDRLQPSLPVPLSIAFRLDWRVVAFSVLLGLVTGVLFGLVPAFQAARADLTTPLKGDAVGRGPRRSRLRHAFVVAQVAMAVLLVVCASLFTRSLRNASAIDPGFSRDNVDIVSLDFRLGGYRGDAALAMAERLLARVGELPRVEAAALTRIVPLTGTSIGLGTLRAARGDGEAPEIRADWNLVTPDYFRTLRIPVIRGRSFGAADRTGAPDVAIVNETLARRAWPGEDAIGQVLQQQGSPAVPPRLLQVVGVVRDGKYRSLGEDPRAFVYVPLAQQYGAELSLAVRREGGPSLIPDIRTLVRDLDGRLPVLHAASLNDTAAIGLLPQRLAASVAAGFSVVGVLLAAIGMYGITAYNVTQRTREIGVRVALGATRRQVLRLVAADGMRLAAIGIVIGVAAALAASQLLHGLLYGIHSIDIVSLGGGVAIFTAVAGLASWLPARRAASLNPVDALKTE